MKPTSKPGIHSLRALLACSMALQLTACGGSDDPPQPELRLTSYGPVRGIDDSQGSGTYSWKGVPFAKPPVGDLRWRPPVEPAAWSGTRDALAFGNACSQNGRMIGPGSNNRYDATIGTTLNQPLGSEDCLYLNIWRPAGDARKLPVIVFVHGGGNTAGYTADPVYDGANLAKAAQAVVVTPNYRLNVFGFFNLPQLKTGQPDNDSGNFGLLDILQALKFVNRNIDAFGGDPGNVTVMGESAGAINTWSLLTSPLAKGLMHKAVPISGGISLPGNLPPGSMGMLNPASVSLNQGNQLLYLSLVSAGMATDVASAKTYAAGMTSQQVADFVRSRPAPALLTTVLSNGLEGSSPIPDGYVLPVDPIAAIAAGNYNAMPVMVANTHDESKPFPALLPLAGGPSPGVIMSDAARFSIMASYDPDKPTLTDADVIAPAYLPVDAPVTGYDARNTVLTRMMFEAGRDNALNTLKTRQNNVWYYRFDWAQEPAPWNHVYGAAHTFDLPFTFSNFGPSVFAKASFSKANEAGRLALSSAMMAALAAFARNGDPNTPSVPVNWTPWPSKLIFDATLTNAKIQLQQQ